MIVGKQWRGNFKQPLAEGVFEGEWKNQKQKECLSQVETKIEKQSETAEQKWHKITFGIDYKIKKQITSKEKKK